MSDVVNKQLDRIVGKSLIGIESAAQTSRLRLIRTAWKYRNEPFRLLQSMLAKPLAKFESFMVDHLTDAYLASWVSGMDYLAKLFPPWLVKEFKTGIRGKPPKKPPGPPWPRFTFYEEDDRDLRFPLIEEAAKRLADRQIMTRAQWEAADRTAREQAFFVTADISVDTIDSIRNAMVFDLDEGTSLKSFTKTVEEALGGSPIGPGHLENVYRTNVQAAFRDGRETLASDPIVSAVFPYQAYDAIHDARARHDHLALEGLGLDGTNIYRRDDPIWDYFTPPWDYNCRCGVNLRTLEAAARAGVREAQEWVKTGKPPARPEFRFAEVMRDVTPVPNFGSRGIAHA